MDYAASYILWLSFLGGPGSGAIIRHGQGYELDSLPGHNTTALKSVVKLIVSLNSS